jgi:ABC-type glycerol-3-phosphate transport system substrate-binding protein
MSRFLRKYKVSIAVIAFLGVSFVLWHQSRGYDDQAMAGIPHYEDVDLSSTLAGTDIRSRLEPSFLKYRSHWESRGAKDTSGVSIVIAGRDYAAASDQGVRLERPDGETQSFLALVDEGGWVEYKVNIPQDGFYQMGMTYYALPGKRSSVVRNLRIDGEFPFYQAKKIEFPRMWQEVGEPWHDNQGNEFNPRREEVYGWQYRDFRDAEGKVAEPFRFYLTAGEHTLRIQAVREPAAIRTLHIFSPSQVPTYEEVRKQYEAQGFQATKGFYQHVQMENAVLRSDPTLKRIEEREPATEPFNRDAIVLNAFGGLNWKRGTQWAEWEFEVPESGLYNLGVRFGQWFLDGAPVQRIVTIDGNLPFREMNTVTFPYKQALQIKRFGTEEEDYLFYLEQGKHRLRMEVQIGTLGEVFEAVNDVTTEMSLLGREVLKITGTNPDPNRDWQLERNISNLVPRLHVMARTLDNAIRQLLAFGLDKNSAQVSPLYEARDRLLAMAEEPETIPARLEALNNQQAALGNWMNGMVSQALLLDYLIVKSPDRPWPPAQAPLYARIGTMIYDFFKSFTRDYNGVGNVYADEQALEVWVARGRDWVEIIKQMIDEDFTPSTGIRVNVNTVPAGQMQVLLLAQTAGIAPDAALGVEGEYPIDFAIRGGLVNLNEFPDYAEVAGRFRPGALIPYKYNGGDYALPENQNFYMLFYRIDIMEELGIREEDIPDTWDEVMELIPILHQNGMDFYYPHAPNNPQFAINEFAPFLFQYGGDFYRDNGRYSALDSSEAFEAFKVWTGLFTNYKIAKQADFYNRFRSGEMPIGVADYSTYVLLSTAAPELTGWWKMKPMPGVDEGGGVINRATGGMAQTAVIFRDTNMKDEAWAFLKWWTSADVQERFGTELESLLGVEARWNTANVEALKRLPWQQSDIDAILEQWEWFREREVVLGGYYTTRHIANIWNEIVLNGKLPREAIEEGVREINKELRKKREEFGLDEVSHAAAARGGDRS